MIAVWSFWSKPFLKHHHLAWHSALHHWLAWVLSVECARQHHRELHLYTDELGARWLVDRLRLPFTQVSMALNDLSDDDPDWWSLGKIYTYRAQTKPFVHIDADVFLWKPLPERLLYADVFTQNAEPIGPAFSFYRPECMEQALAAVSGGWLPEEWRWFRRFGQPQHGECCGVLGGNRLDFIHHYAEAAYRLITDRVNRRAWQRLSEKRWHMILPEQYLIAACADYHAACATSPFRGICLERLLLTPYQAQNVIQQTQTGYTHLLGGMKHNPHVAQRLAAQVRLDYPESYERCVQLDGELTTIEWPR